MSQIDAIYRHGVFEPLGPVPFHDEQRVRLSIEPALQQPLRDWLDKARALQASLIERHGILPDSAPEIAADHAR